jgi:hypothetical protein
LIWILAKASNGRSCRRRLFCCTRCSISCYKSWLKTSGGKGLHVVVPLAPKWDYDVVKDWSQAVVQHLARTAPSRFVAKSGGSNRIGKIFVDYLRNGHGQTTAAAFSARSRPGLGVSMPVLGPVAIVEGRCPVDDNDRPRTPHFQPDDP